VVVQKSAGSGIQRPDFFDDSGIRTKIGNHPTTIQAMKLVQKSRTCKANGHSESLWNHQVHMLLLEKSLKLSAYHEHVDVELLYVHAFATTLT